MFSRIQSPQGEVAVINGAKGIYDGKIENASVRYGRNAGSNYLDYLSKYIGKDIQEMRKLNLEGLSPLDTDKFEAKMSELDDWSAELDTWVNEAEEDLKSIAPINFEYRYAPKKGGSIDTMALLGACYETMEQRTSISIDEMNKKLNFASNGKLSAKAVDLNNDNKIDVAEYATTVILSDVLSAPKSKADGVVTNKGANASLPYLNPKNYAIATKQYQALYDAYNLGNAQREFVSNPNNLI